MGSPGQTYLVGCRNLPWIPGNRLRIESDIRPTRGLYAARREREHAWIEYLDCEADVSTAEAASERSAMTDEDKYAYETTGLRSSRGASEERV